ncbi:hypothetical protein [Sulfobacillus thermosulfidooxidans]|uniref:hypothetical protein n=1 Tax=Sulfobacillus thermosulfidooxidans TaxID=28034 RepID=UPI0006B42361|nr:hypothetical protein [Sulfobacillus thermosulfidooxidans]
MSTTFWRFSGILGLAGSALLSMGHLVLAAEPGTASRHQTKIINTNRPSANTPPITISMKDSVNGTDEGSITITESTSTSGMATWNWSGLGIGDFVNVYTFSKDSPQTPTLLSQSSGKVTTAGSYSANIQLPKGDTWSNTGIEMSESAFAVGQLPEVPWAAALPLLLVVPWGLTLIRHRRQVTSS